MKKSYLFLLVVVVLSSQLKAQIKSLRAGGGYVVRCYAPPPANDDQFEAWLQRKTDERKTQRLDVKSYVVPVIFHVIHEGEAKGVGSNVSQAQLQQQILQLNKDYNNQSNSPYPVAASTGIQFTLAQKDPQGNILPEPGIERMSRSSKGWKELGSKGWDRDYVVSTVKPESIWNPEQYLNIWLVPKMNNGGSGTLLGFSTFPVSSTLDGLNANPAEDNKTAGVVIDYSTVGSLYKPFSCDAEWGRGRTLTHELGHFFGLRHLWGDTKCGTDYVDDTPVHEDANYGKPIHPKPNNCGTADEMFENFMDYSDDEVLNTFTAGQVERMQTVMLFSPRRAQLPSSSAGFVAVTGSNKVAFATCTGEMITTETGTAGIYPRYKDISLTLNAEYAASGAATVTINVAGTAIKNVHYQVLTPTLTFAKGDAFQPVTIRLFDNAAIDGDRTLVVSYTISGSGVVADAASQTMTITVSDDDDILFAGKEVINIVDQKFEIIPGGSLVPAGWSSFISGGYPNVFVASSNGNAGGSGKAAHITNNTSTKPNVYTKGKQGAAELLSPEVNPLQYQSVDTLKFKYSVRGSVDDHGYVLYDIGDGNLYFWGAQGFTGCGPYYGTSSTRTQSLSLAVPAGIKNKKFNIAFYWETDTAKNGSDPGLNIDDVSLTARPYKIETGESTSFGFDVQANSTNKFRSSNNNIVADITAATAKITGVSAGVTEAGTAKASVTLNNEAVSRTKKVITLKSTAQDTTASYTATFYFTSEEMAAWGAKAAGLRLLKVRNGASLDGNLSSTDAVVIIPTAVNNRLSSEGFISYTATVSGFGQYTLIDSTSSLPVFTWLAFSGVLNNNTISLSWTTQNETGNAPFEVQRSTDSTNFTGIGTVNAKNGASNNYTFDDNNIVKGTKYFYRIKQTDNAGNFSYNNIISVAYPADTAVAQWVKLYPNPVHDKLILNFSTTAAQSVNLILSDMAGRVVYKTQTTVVGVKEINTAALSNAVYILKIETADRTESFTIIKQ